MQATKKIGIDLILFISGNLELIRQWAMQRIDVFAQVFLVALSGFLHFWRLVTPDELVFDEIYFPVYANNYLEATSFFDSHPPLGKYLIAFGIRFFGFNPLGYRIMDVLFGIGVVILIYHLGKLLFNSRRVAFLAGFLASLDGMLLVESRAGLINIFAVFFALAAYYLFLLAASENPEKPRWVYLAGTGVSLGAAAAVKWIGVAGLGVILPIYIAARYLPKFSLIKSRLSESPLLKQIGKFHPGVMIACCILIPLAVYSASFVPHIKQNPEYPFVELHRQMFGYHAHLEEGHGYASEWWSWPISQRPVSYYWNIDEARQTVRTILNIGNPLIWWLAIPAVLYALWMALVRRNFGAQFALIALAAHYLPFALISRATFMYHFMGALPFTIILLAFALNDFWLGKKWQKELAFLAIFGIVLGAIYFYPIWTAYPIPAGAFYQRMWFVSWI